MGAPGDEDAVDEVDVGTAWEGLSAGGGSQLIDVRTRAEWTYVGIPDLASLGKRPVLVEWQTFPDQTVDPRFVERLTGELKALGIQLEDDLFFICRSGSRSLAAAKAMAAAGYRNCHNVGIAARWKDGRRQASPGSKARGKVSRRDGHAVRVDLVDCSC